MVENSKQVRVDNWGVFFLQRLQLFFSKTDYCDLTLQFEGNVQLKVHRLVMNACTEYFQFLEQNCQTLEENVIMMPTDLQADVIVPIVNFMYTGMLEFHTSLFEKLYKAAEMMNITVLTKLLDAQKHSIHTSFKNLNPNRKASFPPVTIKKSTTSSSSLTQSKHNELPAMLPGRKLPVWKRKSAPGAADSNKWSSVVPPTDPLQISDNTPRPTRFEWPDEDLPPLNLMDDNFGDISYTSKPLLTQEEIKASTSSFDDVKTIPNSNSTVLSKKNNSNVDMEEMKDYVKEQKIRSDLVSFDADGELPQVGDKRKFTVTSVMSPKRVKIQEKENKETTINISAKSTGGELDHTKIVSQILKKYPQLVNKKKNIRLKIMATGSNNKATVNLDQAKPVLHPPVKTPQMKVQITSTQLRKFDRKPVTLNKLEPSGGKSSPDLGPWKCQKCNDQEFVLYYLFRKHMIDEHHEKFDESQCKYCGHKCKSTRLLYYHWYTKHGLKPPSSCEFPKCEDCPFIALSAMHLMRHQQNHDKEEMQCENCQLAFTSQHTLQKHLQITGHMNKDTKSMFDCQYCTKRYPSAVNLFSHLKLQHRQEAKRDGIVSVEEVDDIDELEEEAMEESAADAEEYIVPEILSDIPDIQRDKVKILSDVKVSQSHQQQTDLPTPVALEPSSEAEALSNVASGIATSLGLVDIVVLDDNQQYILQQPQPNNQSQPTTQPEYILPGGENPFGSVQHSQNTDIGSTDELVMVLTDHDYNDVDNVDGTSTNNSNIVVLYSHPVDGQQGQFITSQGSLMVNSQTGMLEIHNARSPDQHLVVNDQQDTQIESIEMIQREIDSHAADLKPETQFYDENATIEQNHQLTAAGKNMENHDEGLENSTEATPAEENTNNEMEEAPIAIEASEELHQTHEAAEEALELEGGDITVTASEESEEPMETMETLDNMETMETIEKSPRPAEEELHGPEVVESVAEEENATEEPALELQEQESELVESVSEVQEELVEGAVTEEMPEEMLPQQNTVVEEVNEDTLAVNSDDLVTDTMEVDAGEEVSHSEEIEEKVQEDSEQHSTELDLETEVSNTEEHDCGTLEEANPEEQDSQPLEAANQEPQIPIEDPEPHHSEEPPIVYSLHPTGEVEEVTQEDQELLSQSECESPQPQQEDLETSTSQFNDDNSHSSDKTSMVVEENPTPTPIANQSAKISILDDWGDDTDSQQSEQQQAAMKVAGETVDKLMDDWDDEEEDDSKKGAAVE